MIGFDDESRQRPPSAFRQGDGVPKRSVSSQLPEIDAWGLSTARPEVRPERVAARERRRDERFPQVLWLEEILGDDRCIRRTGNISLGGVFFDATVPYPVGTRLCLDIPLPGIQEKIRALAQVIAIRDQGQGMALQFTKFPYGGTEQLRLFLVGQRQPGAATLPE